MERQADLAHLYSGTRQRVTDLVASLGDDELETHVPACPRWNVRDVVSHLVGNIEDVNAGRLTVPPSDELTAQQVARGRLRSLSETLDIWAELAPAFEQRIQESRVWPGVIDVVSHEHDIRGALGRPGDRGTEVVLVSATAALRNFDPPAPVLIVSDDDAWQPGTSNPTRYGPDDADPIELRIDAFELLRTRMGRRSRAQLAALRWSRDPAPVLDHLVIFGPAATDVIE
jgi:uncharacterized protein (TIGR03083 family)